MTGKSRSSFIDGRVLIVEEQRETGEVICECLRSAGAEIVALVPTFAAALQLLLREPVDAVIFDADQISDSEAILLAEELDTRRMPSLMLNGEPVPAGSPLHEGRAEMLWPFSEVALQEMVRGLVQEARRRLPRPR
ncbi:hypothetical protein BKE38_01920 [Pseudoroseomonas deserti]|uniref:Response regulatory domain-containing protein n=1 Tax=Teichococcus deserti TaxID=1817963 RepID=A0A1V2H8K5_9PROT|nr:response regulator [Pseudoroseomonas deserti]ONG58813.1 hypothetical protein BKE38_01920 [Pseudoroseomonas deserti]